MASSAEILNEIARLESFANSINAGEPVPDNILANPSSNISVLGNSYLPPSALRGLQGISGSNSGTSQLAALHVALKLLKEELPKVIAQEKAATPPPPPPPPSDGPSLLEIMANTAKAIADYAKQKGEELGKALDEKAAYLKMTELQKQQIQNNFVTHTKTCMGRATLVVSDRPAEEVADELGFVKGGQPREDFVFMMKHANCPKKKEFMDRMIAKYKEETEHGMSQIYTGLDNRTIKSPAELDKKIFDCVYVQGGVVFREQASLMSEQFHEGNDIEYAANKLFALKKELKDIKADKTLCDMINRDGHGGTDKYEEIIARLEKNPLVVAAYNKMMSHEHKNLLAQNPDILHTFHNSMHIDPKHLEHASATITAATNKAQKEKGVLVHGHPIKPH